MYVQGQQQPEKYLCRRKFSWVVDLLLSPHGEITQLYEEPYRHVSADRVLWEMLSQEPAK